MSFPASAAFVWLVVAQVAAPTKPAQESRPPTLKPAAEVRAAFRSLLDRPRVPLDVTHDPSRSETRDGLVIEGLSFATEKRPDGRLERVPALVVKAVAGSRGRRPAVIVLHGTGGSKDGMRDWLDALAQRGVGAVAIDARYHGDRSGGAGGAAAYMAAITRAWRTPAGRAQEHPFYYDTCWDLWRTVDYLQTREDVDPARIGMLGVSMGGIETWLAASVDDRVAVAVPAIGVQSFRWSLEHGAWQGRANTIKAPHEAAAHDLGEPGINARVCRELWRKVVPGILDDFDGPSMLRLFSPRPLLILNGERDPNCPIEGARVAFAAAESAYREAGAVDRLRVSVAGGVGHAVTSAQHRTALEWLERWLRP